MHFYPRSPCGERQAEPVRNLPKRYFYPRSPCGERHGTLSAIEYIPPISIHALLAESDRSRVPAFRYSSTFLSTLSLRRATLYVNMPCAFDIISIHALLAESDHANRYYVGLHLISIHALLAESDSTVDCNLLSRSNFYPRSPCGERLCGY